MIISSLFATDFIKAFIKELDSNNISYQIMRNYESLPEANSSKDVDILVKESDAKKIKSYLLDISKKLEYSYIWSNELDYLDGYAFCKAVSGKVYSIKIDIFKDLRWKGLFYADTDYLLANNRIYNTIQVPNSGCQSFTMVMYYILYAKNIPEKYHKEITEGYTNDKSKFKEQSMALLGDSLTAQIGNLVEQNKVSQIQTKRQEIISRLKKHELNKNAYKRKVLHIQTEVLKRMSFGRILAFSGPDGVGKSSILENVTQVFAQLGIGDAKEPYHFLHPSVQPIHKVLPASKEIKHQDYTKPFSKKPSGPLLSVVRGIYYLLAFFRNYFILKIGDLRANKIVIFDRYFTDLIAIPERVRIGLSQKAIGAVFSIVPFPDVAIVLVADKETILKRKKELTEEQLVDFLARFKSLEQYDNRVLVLQNNGTLEDGVTKVLQTIFEKLDKVNLSGR